MVKKILVILVLSAFTPLFCACGNERIVTSTGKLGRRAEAYKKHLPVQTPGAKPLSKGNVIYLGKEYENNNFGPAGIKFVFER